jgi:hypothetical protein
LRSTKLQFASSGRRSAEIRRHRDDPLVDIDLASAGVVKVVGCESGSRDHGGRYADMPWEPKAAFDALADCYAR